MADLGDLADLDGEGDFNDPMGEQGGVEGAAASAGEAAVQALSEGKIPSGPSLPAEVQAALPETVTASVTAGLETIPDGSIAGKQIQANLTVELKDPAVLGDLADNAIVDAAAKHGGDISSVTAEDLKSSLDTQITQKALDAKTAFKTELTQALTDVDPSLGNSGDFVNQMVEDPETLKTNLQAAADALPDDMVDQLNEEADQTSDPEKKSALKEAASKILGYAGKGLLVLAVIGGLIPGTGGVIDKIASLAGQAISKVVNAAASIAQALFGPFITDFWNLVKKFKWPFIILGVVLALILVIWIYRTVRGI